MNRTKTSRLLTVLFAGINVMAVLYGLQSCSKKSGASKSAAATSSEPAPAQAAPAPPPPAEEKDGMQITRDAAGNYVIHLVVVNLQPVKLMKPVKEGYVVWVVTDAGVPVNIGNIEGANTWTDKKDKTKFEATHPVKPVKVFITAETDLKAQKPGTQVVWSTGNF
ncbi:MAG: hypothetical protein ACKOU7_02745 [Ferruginibacter sp.]